MFLVTNSFIKNSHTLYAGKNKYSSSLKIFSWCSNDKHWHNIPGKISFILLIILFILIIERISTSCIFTNVKCLIRTKFSCRHGLLLIVAGKYTIIPCRRLNRQVTLAVYFFYVSHRFPVEHVQTPGGQTTFEAWKPFIVGVLFLSILLNIFFFLPVKICRDL